MKRKLKHLWSTIQPISTKQPHRLKKSLRNMAFGNLALV